MFVPENPRSRWRVPRELQQGKLGTLAFGLLIAVVMVPALVASATLLALQPPAGEAMSFALVASSAFAAALLAALRWRIALVHEAMDATQSLIAIYDPTDRLFICNRRYREVLNVPEDVAPLGTSYEEIARLALEASHPDGSIEAELKRRVELHRSADGVPNDRSYGGRMFRVTKSRTRSGVNVGVGIDVCQIYELEAELTAQVNRFRALANDAPVGICQIGSDGALTFVNDQLCTTVCGSPTQTRSDESCSSALEHAVFELAGERIKGMRELAARLPPDTCEHEVTYCGSDEPRHLFVKRSAAKEDDGQNVVDLFTTSSQHILIFVDITERKKAEARIEYLAMHDMLTGARNRLAFTQHLNEAVEHATTRDPISLLAIDLDGFKPVNDEHGHQLGDELLRAIVGRLTPLMGDGADLYRTGGDEFSILCHADPGHARDELAKGVLAALVEPFPIDGRELRIGASIGISTAPSHARAPQVLMHYADLALYSVKKRGGRGIGLFDRSMCAGIAA